MTTPITVKNEVGRECDCEICKMTIQEAKNIAFLNLLYEEITAEEYDNINQMLNNYGAKRTTEKRITQKYDQSCAISWYSV